MKKAGIAAGFGVFVALAAVVAALAHSASGATAPGTTAAPAAAEQAACRSRSIGVMAPLTGPAAFLGQEQLSWARFALRNFNRQFRTSFKVVLGDSQLSAALARTVGRQFVSNRNIMAVIGGSTSQSVISSAGLFRTARLASISPSATRVDLTNGRYPTFFRVVPHDGVQAPDIARYIATQLRADRVVVLDSQDDYSVPLSDAVQQLLRGRGVTVDRESTAATTTDFSTIATRVAADADVVVFATQTASAAQALSEQLLAQGKRAVVFGTDGAYSPSQYKPRNGYVSSFANDLHFVASARALVRQYNTFSRNKTFGTFGPPSYMATWAALTAMNIACRDGEATRNEVTNNVKRTNMPSILGGRLRFTARGDVRSPKFYIFRVQNGTYRLVG
jgi:branched-chain amino acid transport system substrate-binding protein